MYRLDWEERRRKEALIILLLWPGELWKLLSCFPFVVMHSFGKKEKIFLYCPFLVPTYSRDKLLIYKIALHLLQLSVLKKYFSKYFQPFTSSEQKITDNSVTNICRTDESHIPFISLIVYFKVEPYQLYNNLSNFTTPALLQAA